MAGVLLAMAVLGLGILPSGSATAAALPATRACTPVLTLAAAMPDRAGDEDRPRQQRLKKRRIATPRVVSVPAAAKQARPAAGFIAVALASEADADGTRCGLPCAADQPQPIQPPTRHGPPGQAPPRA